jgi:hypothetical protein
MPAPARVRTRRPWHGTHICGTRGSWLGEWRSWCVCEGHERASHPARARYVARCRLPRHLVPVGTRAADQRRCEASGTSEQPGGASASSPDGDGSGAQPQGMSVTTRHVEHTAMWCSASAPARRGWHGGVTVQTPRGARLTKTPRRPRQLDGPGPAQANDPGWRLMLDRWRQATRVLGRHIRRTEIQTLAVGLAAAGLALFVSTTGPVRVMSGAVGAAGLIVMLGWRRAEPPSASQPGREH